MRFTAEDLRRQMEQTPGMNAAPQPGAGMEELLGSMATAAQNSLLEACPVFIERLRNSQHLAQRLKQMMQGWADESPPAIT
jgi:hypothetical protein